MGAGPAHIGWPLSVFASTDLHLLCRTHPPPSCGSSAWAVVQTAHGFESDKSADTHNAGPGRHDKTRMWRTIEQERNDTAAARAALVIYEHFRFEATLSKINQLARAAPYAERNVKDHYWNCMDRIIQSLLQIQCHTPDSMRGPR